MKSYNIRRRMGLRTAQGEGSSHLNLLLVKVTPHTASGADMSVSFGAFQG